MSYSAFIRCTIPALVFAIGGGLVMHTSTPSSIYRFQNESESIVAIHPGGDYLAIDGRNGNVFSRDADADVVINAAIGALDPLIGGRIFIKAGQYSVAAAIRRSAVVRMERANGLEPSTFSLGS